MELRVFTEPQQGATYDDLLAVARTAEECGYGAFFRSDHYLAMGDGDGLPGPTDAWITLAGLARETSTIRLGTLVTAATFRHPGPLAVSVAQVDAMSGGRVELGLGSGWFAEEHQRLRDAVPGLGERFDRYEEQLAVITGLWCDPGRGALRLRGPALHPRRLARRCPSRSRSTCRSLVGGGGKTADATAGGHLRRRVQRALRCPWTRPPPSWTGCARPARRSTGTPRA